MADPRDIYGYYRQKQFEQFMASLGKGAGLLGVAGDIPQGWEPPPMPPDPLRDYEWMPRRGFFLGYDASVGDNAVVSEMAFPSAGASDVIVAYRVYNVLHATADHEPVLQIMTGHDPENPSGWSVLATVATMTATTAGTSGKLAVSSSIGRFVKWRVCNPATASGPALVDLQSCVSIIGPAR
jgi:hypothetical protein